MTAKSGQLENFISRLMALLSREEEDLCQVKLIRQEIMRPDKLVSLLSQHALRTS